MDMTQLVLASSSPRRRQLLEMAGLRFAVLVSDIDEQIQPNEPPAQIVQALAFQKAKAVQRMNPDAYIIGADTIVVYNGQILGKPKTTEEAYEMLRTLSGKTHDVFTGVAIIAPHEETTFVERTEVTFWELTEDEITAYIETGEPMDKAGAYGIQGRGALLVQRIVGDYYAVMGLPLAKTVRELTKLGWQKGETT